ncbi:endomembrane protein, putative [Leishmania tarentolae]|uniref:Transmembrane 9 superfamily member n=1 Tax=Leishmania tarentolae TaxID=5689 RepID=A0A640KCT7_LEITA|nr:endomembrane protein, putative [Leishmania tarentolae]
MQYAGIFSLVKCSSHYSAWKMRPYSLLTVTVLVCVFCIGAASASRHTYVDGDEIKIYAGKVRSRTNPYETYHSQGVPACILQANEESLSLGQLLAGVYVNTLARNIRFNQNKTHKLMCQQTYNPDETERLKELINDYYYELIIDELPVWGAIGEQTSDKEFSIFLHQTFYIGVNGNEIVNVTLVTSSPTKFESDTVYTYTYSVVFQPSKVEYTKRFLTVFQTSYLTPRARFASLISTCLIVLFLFSLIALIVSRVLHSEQARMEKEAHLRSDGQDISDESGWRCLYADVFRVPRYPGIFCAILGCGTQLLVLATAVISLSVMNNHTISNHSLMTFTVYGYALTSYIAGYVSGYQLMGFGFLSPTMASRWIRAFHITFILVPGIYATAVFFSSTVAILYGSSEFPYIKGVIIVLCLWVFVAYPLCLVGVLCSRYVFRRTERRRNIPHVNQIPRLVLRPPRKLLAPCSLLLVSGIIPFFAIFLEFSFVFASVWSFRIFHFHGLIAITAILYIVVTAFVSVVATFLLLSTENHYWKWMSMGFGASCSMYAFAYAIFFYVFKSSMHGLLMFVVYYSYCFVFMLPLALIGATVSYFSASYFVKSIYAQGKND